MGLQSLFLEGVCPVFCFDLFHLSQSFQIVVTVLPASIIVLSIWAAGFLILNPLKWSFPEYEYLLSNCGLMHWVSVIALPAQR